MRLLSHCPTSLLLSLGVALSSHAPKVSALQGDLWCGTLMCVRATVNPSTVTYELKSLSQLGWMAIGFGTHMANSPMVIVWQIPNGTTILSQRQASGLEEPLPVVLPPRVASLSHGVSTSLGLSSILAFDIPKNDTVQSLIWAFGTTTPDSSPTASIEQHLDAGAFSLDLTKELLVAVSETGTTGTISPAPPPQSSSAFASDVLSRTNSLQVAHAVLCAAGFLIVLPLGTLSARWSRVFTPKWFTAHWIINVVLGIPLVCVGWAFGPLAVAQQGREHIVTAHQICGVVLFVLYIIEVGLGTLVHLRRSKQRASHPPRNIIHVGLGLAVFGLSIYEAVNGVHRDSAINSASRKIVVVICLGWAVAFAGTYALGLLFLRRQFAQERLGWNVPSSVPIPLPTIAPQGSDPVRRRAAGLQPPMPHDGPHDVCSEAWGSSVEGRSGEAHENLQERTEMRQVQAMPVSLPALV
ncbi:hypothetical protein C8Q74DRAFT_1226759 [Fomes fomentarius]|nr:hypothetical protein C8Q74DRAFT_1226759 [Fomes fomentarius]